MAKKPQTAKARAASKKNILDWENKQAMANRVSDNKSVALTFFVLGFVVCLLAAFLSLGIWK